jgi:16S rRNA (uracil1498-N3)-methyltransferase
MHLFYTPDIVSETYVLNEEESKHCIRVLRLQSGDRVVLVDGKGGFYQAEIIDPHPKKTILKIVAIQLEYAKRNHYLHVAVAPTKNIERIEWFLEKATEIGIDEISFIICDRSERKEVKIDRLTKVVTSAVKQSLKAYHPKLNEAIYFKNFIRQAQTSQKFIAHCVHDDKKELKDHLQLYADCIILVGPEGDFTPNEITLAIDYGFVPITLGNSRLRTETAALGACFEINFLNR